MLEGDGNCCENGAGWAKVEMNGVEEAYIDDFTSGQVASATFGCNGGGGGSESEEDPDAGPICGNGVVEGSEECDDGNQNDSKSALKVLELYFAIAPIHPLTRKLIFFSDDDCTNQCTIAVCGDGIVGPGEQCDDGNDIDE